MVICSDHLLSIGEQPGKFGTLTDARKIPHKQAFTVLRRATRDEYESYCRKEWGYRGSLPHREYYYLVAID
jgi:hypothetical protein